MFWLDEKRGYLTDWTTQLWVRMTGRHVNLQDHPWLEGPVGPTHGIGEQYFAQLAAREGLTICAAGPPRGIVPDFNVLRSQRFDPSAIHREVIAFYQQTSVYELEAWSQWCDVFRPFGWLLAVLFSRRLQQLNVPLSGLDTSRGVTNDVHHLVEPHTGTLRYAVWVRHMIGNRQVLYAGSYGPCRVPCFAGVCLKVVFPLPNGNALVIMRPEAHPDGSVSFISQGDTFGSPGFYLVVHDTDKRVWVRYVRTMRESIRVYAAGAGEARADHLLTIWGREFLKLHYRLRRVTSQEHQATI
jgi:hypothetical protein